MRKTAILVALALLAAVPAFAQQTGTITGTATDEQGAVLPGVTVTVIMAAAPLAMPSLAIMEIKRSRAVGFWLVLLYLISRSAVW